MIPRNERLQLMKYNFWPWGIGIAFAMFISGTAGLIVMASMHKAELVNDHYYEQELRYQDQMDSVARAQRAGGGASIEQDATSGRLLLRVPPEHVRSGVTGRIELYRASSAGRDRVVVLAPDPNGMQTLELKDLLPGPWKVRLSWSSAGAEYLLERKITNGAVSMQSVSKR
jgi:hypothetical protein